jgi:hypothetical protein
MGKPVWASPMLAIVVEQFSWASRVSAAEPISEVKWELVSKVKWEPFSDVDISRVTQVDEDNTPININQGPITRSRAKKLQKVVNSLLAEIKFNVSENVILPKCSTLVVLRYICERGGAAIHGEEAKKKNQVDQFGPRMNQQVQFGQVRTDQFGQVRTDHFGQSVRTCSDLHNDLIITFKSG